MYVWARFAKLVATAPRRERLDDPLGVSSLQFRALPSDVDFNFHVNNGRYLAIADLGRLDLFFRSGLVAEARRRGWVPMLGGLESVFRREIRLWQRFRLDSRFLGWEGSNFVGEHRFVLPGDPEQIAVAVLTSGGIYDRTRRSFVEADRVLEAMGRTIGSPPLDEASTAFVEAYDALRRTARHPAVAGSPDPGERAV